MNQEKIGKFIAELRKEMNMTQQDLADKLGVTDRAISNWENGRRLPDYSLLKPISDILCISVNELLSGERIDKKDFQKKSDDNIIEFAELINLRSMKYGILGMCFFFIVLVIISFYKDISPAPLISLICAYNFVTLFSRYKLTKSKSILVASIMCGIAMICNTIIFILV